MNELKFGILGSGSWGTALAKLLTDNNNSIQWWLRNDQNIDSFLKRRHNPQYLRNAYFDTSLLGLSTNIEQVIEQSDCIVIVIPSAYIIDTLGNLPRDIFHGKKILSAVKGILPQKNLLLNDYLRQNFNVSINDYFTVLGPCHAEEVASEKLSYLTFSGIDKTFAQTIANHFKTSFLNTITNNDIYGVQYAAVLKNIYAVAAGIAHGLDYGDNFLSVLIANSADEMAGFLRKCGTRMPEVGTLEHRLPKTQNEERTNYAASVYLGDLLVTCYSLYSRNRTFGNMIGKGYSVRTAQLEMNMVAEGYNASKCIFLMNKSVGAEMPVAETVYNILWNNLPPREGFDYIESMLI